MSDATRDPTARFSGLSELYAKHRPGYPAEAIDFIVARAGLKGGSTLLDVGAGTGISSRLFAARKLSVIRLEPNADLRARAEAEPAPEGSSPIRYVGGRAEATGLPDRSVDAALAAQAFHWFEPAPTLR